MTDEQPILPIGDINVNFDPNPMVIHHGRGPDDARCKTCRHIFPHDFHNRRYWKCEWRGVSSGSGTDHRLKWNACRLYEEETP